MEQGQCQLRPTAVNGSGLSNVMYSIQGSTCRDNKAMRDSLWEKKLVERFMVQCYQCLCTRRVGYVIEQVVGKTKADEAEKCQLKKCTKTDTTFTLFKPILGEQQNWVLA